jgi:plasmid stabilization system protein ParE
MNAPKRHPLANSDIERAARYYDGKKPGLGDDFTDEVEQIVRVISENPLRYSIRFGAWRRANLGRFPYAVFYQIVDDTPVIFAVLYGRSDFKPVLEQRQT